MYAGIISSPSKTALTCPPILNLNLHVKWNIFLRRYEVQRLSIFWRLYLSPYLEGARIDLQIDRSSNK